MKKGQFPPAEMRRNTNLDPHMRMNVKWDGEGEQG